MYLIQSKASGLFLAPVDGCPSWVAPLDQAFAGAVPDLDTCFQLIEDHADSPEDVQIHDLNELYLSIN